MLSTSRSQKQFFSGKKSDKLKSKSASPTLRKSTKEQSQEKRIQSSTSERESGKLSVQEIVSISFAVLNFLKLSLTESKLKWYSIFDMITSCSYQAVLYNLKHSCFCLIFIGFA